MADRTSTITLRVVDQFSGTLQKFQTQMAQVVGTGGQARVLYDQYGNVMRTAAVASEQAATSQTRAARATAGVAVAARGATTAATQHTAAVMANTGRTADATRASMALNSQLIQLGRGMMSTFTGFIAGVAAAAALKQVLSATIGAAIGFDTAMRQVNTVALLNEQQFGRLSQEVRDFAVNEQYFIGTAKDAANALNIIVQAGIPVERGLTMLRAASVGSAAGFEDIRSVTEALVGIMNAYGESQERAMHNVNVLAQTVAVGVITWRELTQNIGEVIQTAAAAQVPLEVVGAALATMTQKGIQADLAVTSLNRILLSIISPSQEAKKTAEELGIAWNFQTLQTKGLIPMLEEMARAAGGDQEAISNLLGDVRAFRGVLALTNDGGIAFNRTLEQMERAQEGAGAATEQAQQYAKTAQANLNDLKQAAYELAITLGTVALPALTSFVAGLTKLIDLAKTAALAIPNFFKALFGPAPKETTAELEKQEAITRSIMAMNAQARGAAAPGPSIWTQVGMTRAQVEERAKAPLTREQQLQSSLSILLARGRAAPAGPLFPGVDIWAGAGISREAATAQWWLPKPGTPEAAAAATRTEQQARLKAEQRQALAKAGAGFGEEYLIGQREQAIDTLNEQLDRLQASSQGAGDATRALRREQREAQAAMQDSAEEVRRLEGHLTDLRRTLDDLARPRLIGAGAFEEQVFRLEQQIREARLAELMGGGDEEARRALEQQLEILRLQREIYTAPVEFQAQRMAQPPPPELTPEAVFAQISETQQAIVLAQADLVVARAIYEANQVAVDNLTREMEELQEATAGAASALRDQEEALRSQIKQQQALIDAIRQAIEEAELREKLTASADAFKIASDAMIRQMNAIGGSADDVTKALAAMIRIVWPETRAEPDYGPYSPVVQRQGGGFVSGAEGSPQLILAHAGELILNRAQQRAATGAGLTVTNNFNSAFPPRKEDADSIAAVIEERLQDRHARTPGGLWP